MSLPPITRLYSTKKGIHLVTRGRKLNDVKTMTDPIREKCLAGLSDRLPDALGSNCSHCGQTIDREVLVFPVFKIGHTGTVSVKCPFCLKVFFPPQSGPPEKQLRMIEAQRYYDMAQERNPKEYNDTPDVVDMLKSLQHLIAAEMALRPRDDTRLKLTTAKKSKAKVTARVHREVPSRRKSPTRKRTTSRISKGKSVATQHERLSTPPPGGRPRSPTPLGQRQGDELVDAMVWVDKHESPVEIPVYARNGEISLALNHRLKKVLSPVHTFRRLDIMRQEWQEIPSEPMAITLSDIHKLFLRSTDVGCCLQFSTFYTYWEQARSQTGDEGLLSSLGVENSTHPRVALLWNMTQWRAFWPGEDPISLVRHLDEPIVLFKTFSYGEVPGLGSALRILDPSLRAMTKMVMQNVVRPSNGALNQRVPMLQTSSARTTNATPMTWSLGRVPTASGILPSPSKATSSRVKLEDDIIELSD
ncbi:uncharacterized protein BXZ73DRAFT_83244 [Epithele typhae]|uniref:uncharacterized protein n=1 Tax=Epithele typhae TaxID=378194 RepID=UPI002008E625|nr:uncharacterized protein BXZ73DRAFT_83244 [Epithele typhae]KAH9910733.1 hypothetical protein BXZ73DRAFT_83244 [Epithele typhae]